MSVVGDLTWVAGTGNRFALHDALKSGVLEDPASLARELSADVRRPDGLLAVDRDEAGRLRMTIYNRDGSRPQACGNGLRCVAWYGVRAGHAQAGVEFPIATDAGVRRALVAGEPRVSMGAGQRVAEHALDLGGALVTGHECDLGNPHLVIVRDALRDEDVLTWGPALQERFPAGINVEFVVVHPDRFEARVWERGVGETAACGTGACAIALALANTLPAAVDLPGGRLTIDMADGELWLSGAVEELA